MKNKLTGVLLLTFILFQGCTVYHKTSVSMEEAINQGKVKVVYGFGAEQILDNIVLEDSVYYGVKGGKVTQLHTEENYKVYIKNKTKSIIKPVVSVLGIAALFVIISVALFRGI
jgi:hypothetical protein